MARTMRGQREPQRPRGGATEPAPGAGDWQGVSQEPTMPAQSKKQQMAAGAALAAKRGERSKSSLKGASREMVNSMSEKQLEEFAHTKRKGLPRKKD
jgi:hypothetical protein